MISSRYKASKVINIIKTSFIQAEGRKTIQSNNSTSFYLVFFLPHVCKTGDWTFQHTGTRIGKELQIKGRCEWVSGCGVEGKSVMIQRQRFATYFPASVVGAKLLINSLAESCSMPASAFQSSFLLPKIFPLFPQSKTRNLHERRLVGTFVG